MDTGSRDLLARLRTVMANERTLLAYIRTALGLVLGGLGLIKFLTHPVMMAVGWLLIAFGTLMAVVGIFRFRFLKSLFSHLELEKLGNQKETDHH